MNGTLRVVVVDDHAGFRAAARRLLEADGFEVVGEAADGPDGVRAAEALRPDLVLVDVGLPTGDGFDVAAAVGGGDANSPRPTVVLVTSRDPGAYADRLRRSPALGLLAKHQLAGGHLRHLLTRSRHVAPR